MLVELDVLTLIDGDSDRWVRGDQRGEISLYARADDGTPRGTVFVPFCFYEAAANMLTNPVLDPFGKIPEFKFCAAKVERVAVPAVAAQ